MISLLMTTTSLGLVDSLNPFGVSMQFVLQGQVKKSWHIWFYIVATGVTNLLGGLLAYFGLFNLLSDGWSYLLVNYRGLVITLELIVAMGLLFYATYQIIEPKLQARMEEATGYQFQAEGKTVKVRSVSPRALVIIGAGTAISELTSAFPYFAFLAYLFSQELSVISLLIILVYYNILYCAPLIVLFYVYRLAHQQFDRLYEYIQRAIERFSYILTPFVTGIIAATLIYLAVQQLL